MRCCLYALAVVLSAPPGVSSAKGGPGEIPASLVKACLERCQAASLRCNRHVRQVKQEKTKDRPRSRKTSSRSLRTCGCAYVGCKNLCKGYGWFSFSCHGSSRPRPRPVPRSTERACKRDRDCTLMPTPSPCSCPQCGVYWRRAVNKKTLRAWRSKWARRRCAKKRCPACDSWALGRSAYCHNGQCHVRP